MDQVKAILAVMKKNAFWILIGVVVLMGLGVWFISAAALAKRYEERKSTLETKYTTVSGIKSEATGEDAEHPNEQTIEQWEARVGRNRVEALKAWNVMYDDQKLRNQWPRTLSPLFHRMIRTIGDRDIPNEFLEEYQTFIKKHFPDMDKIIDRRRVKKVEGARGAMPGMPGAGGYSDAMTSYGGMSGGMSGEYGGMSGESSGMDPYGTMGGTGGMPVAGAEMEGIVEWDQQDYARIQNGVYWVTRPLTVEVRLAQEDLWVYEALLRSIAKTNKDAGAKSYYNAAIKRIVALEIGQPAAMAMKSAKSRLGLDKMFAAGGGSGYDESMMGSGSEMDYGGSMGDSMMGDSMMGSGMEGYGDGSGMMGATTARDPEMVAKRLLTGRYVDLTGEPQAADSEPYAEFKLMPVHIVVFMDQQKLPDFLVNLANCEMPVDVKQVSIKADGTMNFSTGGMGGGMGGYGDTMGGYGSDMMGSGMMGGGGMGGRRYGGRPYGRRLRRRNGWLRRRHG